MCHNRQMEPITTGPDRRVRDAKPHYVYECWADNACLYVGMSAAPGRRLASHASTEWWPRTRRVEIHWFPDRQQAVAREHELIDRHQPLNNFYLAHAAEGSRSGGSLGDVAWRKADVIP